MRVLSEDGTIGADVTRLDILLCADGSDTAGRQAGGTELILTLRVATTETLSRPLILKDTIRLYSYYLSIEPVSMQDANRG